MKNYMKVVEEDGRIYFEDEQERVEISEMIDPDKLRYDEYNGYILPDGRNLEDIIVEAEYNEAARISVDNGANYCTVMEAIAAQPWEEIVSCMDDETREAVHAEIAPCSNEEFLSEYLCRAEHDLIIG